MSDIPDSTIWRLIESLGPVVHASAVVITGASAWCARWVTTQFRILRDRVSSLETTIPQTYQTKTETNEAIRKVGEEMKDHVDTIRTDVRTLHGDVKDLLKMLANRNGPMG